MPFLHKRNFALFSITAVIATVWFLLAVFLLLVPVVRGQNTLDQVSILNLGQGQVLSQNYTLNFEGNELMEDLELRFISLDPNGDDKVAYAQRDGNEGNIWHYQLDISELGDGSYRLEAIAILLDGTVVAGETREFMVSQAAPSSLLVEIIRPQLAEVVDGIYQFRAQVNELVDEFYFKVTNSFGLLRAYLSGDSSSNGLVYEAEYNTLNVDDGQYSVSAEATLAGTTTESDQVTFYVDNQAQTSNTDDGNGNDATTTVNTVSVFFTHPDPGTIASGRLLVQARTSREVDDVYFRIHTEYIDAQEFDQDSWQAYIDTTDYSNGPLQIIAVASLDGSNFYSDILDLSVYNAIADTDSDQSKPTQVSTDAKIQESFNKTEEKVDLNTDSNNDAAGDSLLDDEDGDKHRVECRNIDISNITCDVYLQNRATLSDECVAKVIDLDACLRQEEQRNKCQSLGFEDYGLCAKYLTEPRLSRWCNLAEFKDQPICLSYLKEEIDLDARGGGANKAKPELEKLCLEQEITDSDKCERFITYLSLPAICKRQQISTAEQCRKFLQDNYLELACQQAGIADLDTCRDYFVLTSRAKLVCAAGDCEQIVAKKYVPQLAARAVADREVTNKLAELANKNFKLTSEEPESVEADIIGRLPIKYKSGQNLRIVPTEDMIKVAEERLYTVLPAAIVRDSDGDGLPDDVEVRLGTDSDNPDTDSDGYLDGQEVANGYDPLQPGKRLVRQLAPIEKALVKGKVLEQPLIRGQVSDDITVEVINSESVRAGDQGEEGHLVMSGLAPAFTVVTLYIYSDLPLVATAQVDEYGRWQYTLQDSLVDGEHQVFVAINDDTGRIVKKSAGSIFFVKEAKAVTAEEVVNLQMPDDSSSLEKYYLGGAVGLVILALVIFIFLRRGLSKGQVVE